MASLSRLWPSHKYHRPSYSGRAYAEAQDNPSVHGLFEIRIEPYQPRQVLEKEYAAPSG